MGIEENKEVVSRLAEAMEKHDISSMDELLTDDCVFHLLNSNPPQDKGREQVKETFIANIFSDQTFTVDDVIAEGDRVLLRLTVSGKHTGKILNIEPTGKFTSATRFSIYRVQDGKIAECWTLNNDLDLYQQLGALPPSEEIGK